MSKVSIAIFVVSLAVLCWLAAGLVMHMNPAQADCMATMGRECVE